jgi:CSLREA domain-containing protein
MPASWFVAWRRPPAFAVVVLLIAALLGGADVRPARADVIVVTTLSDATGGSDCTLRDAIAAANLDAAVGGCAAGSGADTVALATGATYTFAAADNTVGGANALPAVVGDLTLEGRGSVIARSEAAGTPEFRLLRVQAGGKLRLRGVTVSNGRIAGDGAGVSVSAGGAVDVRDGVFRGNWAGASGGAIAGPGPIAVAGTTFSGNHAGAFGGAIAGNDETVANSTFTANDAGIGGGALFIDGTLSLVNSTVAVNSGYGVFKVASGTTTVTNSILANNSPGNCAGGVTDGGGNLQWPTADVSCVGTHGDPRLGSLQYNGGPTPTMGLGAGSAAIDAGQSSGCLPTDQRGVARPQDGDGDGAAACDIGAYEVGSFRLYLPLITRQ